MALNWRLPAWALRENCLSNLSALTTKVPTNIAISRATSSLSDRFTHNLSLNAALSSWRRLLVLPNQVSRSSRCSECTPLDLTLGHPGRLATSKPFAIILKKMKHLFLSSESGATAGQHLGKLMRLRRTSVFENMMLCTCIAPSFISCAWKSTYSTANIHCTKA